MITLKTLADATEQEVFDQVANHLLTQMKKSEHTRKNPYEYVNCLYRSSDGLKCAAGWNQSTDLLKAIQLILDTAIKGSVDPSDMPQTLLILSDMQFNSSWNNIGKDLTAFKSIKKMYNDAGYEIPNIVFWNLCAHDNVPVKFDKIGVALVSGFSPSIIKSILSSSDDFTPMGIMMKALSDPRYNLNTIL